MGVRDAKLDVKIQMAFYSPRSLRPSLPLCLWAALLAVCCASAKDRPRDGGDDAVPGLLTLGAARRIAFQRNWDLLAAQAGVDLAAAQKIVAHEFPNPTLSYSTQKINTDTHSSGTPAGNTLWNRNYDTIFAVNQLYEIDGKR